MKTPAIINAVCLVDLHLGWYKGLTIATHLSTVMTTTNQVDVEEKDINTKATVVHSACTIPPVIK